MSGQSLEARACLALSTWRLPIVAQVHSCLFSGCSQSAIRTHLLLRVYGNSFQLKFRQVTLSSLPRPLTALGLHYAVGSFQREHHFDECLLYMPGFTLSAAGF